jgi:hypothetical protein
VIAITIVSVFCTRWQLLQQDALQTLGKFVLGNITAGFARDPAGPRFRPQADALVRTHVKPSRSASKQVAPHCAQSHNTLSFEKFGGDGFAKW